MKKISTLYKKNPNHLALVIDEIDPDNAWVFTDAGVKATRKWDGTACAIIDGVYYKRYDVKKGKSVPEGAIPCQDPDPITGHWPHWIKVEEFDTANRWHILGYNMSTVEHGAALPDGTYELVGPGVQGNPEGLSHQLLVRHGDDDLDLTIAIYDFNMFHEFLANVNIEGIVFHHPDGRMCKLRKSDYGIKRPKN